jgi:5-methylcytosine-specific restriction protein A
MRYASAKQIHSWRTSRRWRKQIELNLREHPLCAFCLQKGLVVEARVVDHIDRHFGDKTTFFTGRTQNLCFACHDVFKRQIERGGGFTREVGADGFPTDPAHPFNRVSRWGGT